MNAGSTHGKLIDMNILNPANETCLTFFQLEKRHFHTTEQFFGGGDLSNFDSMSSP